MIVDLSQCLWGIREKGAETELVWLAPRWPTTDTLL